MNRKQRKRLVKLFRQGLFRADMLVPGAKVLIQHYRIDEAHTCRKPVSFRFKKSGPNKSQWIPSTKDGETHCLIILPGPYRLNPGARGDITIRGEARCHSDLDGYNRRVGAHTAFGRAMKTLQGMENDDQIYLEVTDENITRIAKETRAKKQRRDLENSVGWLKVQVALRDVQLKAYEKDTIELRKKLGDVIQQVMVLECQVAEWERGAKDD